MAYGEVKAKYTIINSSTKNITPPLKMDNSENGGFGRARSVVLIDFGRSIDLRSRRPDCNIPLDSVAYLQQPRNGDANNLHYCVNKA